MSFGKLLTEYISELGISSRELAAASGVSEAALSRYRKDQRIPESSRIDALAEALFDLSQVKGIDIGGRDEIRLRFNRTVPGGDIDYDSFIGLLKELTASLGITNVMLARELNFDPSHISRIFSGERRINDVTDFAYKCAAYVAGKYGNGGYAGTISALTGCSAAEASDQSSCIKAIYTYLTEGELKTESHIGEFLKHIDDFDFNEFTSSIRFDELKVPSAPFQIHRNRTYYGNTGYMECEIEFNKAVILSKSDEPVIMYSDMPIDEIASDEEMTKKYLFSLALMIKKGLHLNVIHNIDRPMNEMMEGLKGWIPMYMTGQISPYSLTSKGSPFRHMIRSAGRAAVIGTGITGDAENNRFYLTQNREEVEHISTQAKMLLKKASPLMEIYTESTNSRLYSFFEKESAAEGDRYQVLPAPPLFLISDELLDEILDENRVEQEEKEKIKEHKEFMRYINEKILKKGKTVLLLPEMNGTGTHRLDLSTMFIEKDIIYTEKQYERHMEETIAYIEAHDALDMKIIPDPPFKNVRIMIRHGSLAMISKSKAPAIHYVITQSNMVKAFEQFVKTYANSR